MPLKACDALALEGMVQQHPPTRSENSRRFQACCSTPPRLRSAPHVSVSTGTAGWPDAPAATGDVAGGAVIAAGALLLLVSGGRGSWHRGVRSSAACVGAA
eukprot:1884662-Prymnesium_polylepis.1